MNQKIIVGVSVLLCLLTVSCHKKVGGAATSASEVKKLTEAYGFAAQTPKESEGFIAVYNLKKLWQDFLVSKTGMALRSAPSVQQAFSDPALRTGIDEAKKEIGVKQLRPLVTDLFGDEIFVILSHGSAQRLHAFQHFNNELRLEDFLSGIASALQIEKSGEKLGAYLAIYKANADSLQIPPLIVGGKVSTQKAALLQELERLENKLPVGVDKASFNFNGNHPFKSLVFNVSKLLSPDLQEQFKQALAAKISDPKAVDEIFQSVMVRKIEIAYGFVGDYFLASIGTDHSHLKLASNFGDSLLARPELAVAAQFVDKPALSLSWGDKSLVALSLPHYKLTSVYSYLKPTIDANLSGIDFKKLEADLARIDTKAASVFPTEVDPLVSIIYRDRGICSETFGGMKSHGFDKVVPLKFAGVPSDSTFLWMDAQSNPTLNAAYWDWLGDFVATGYDWFQTLGAPKLPATQKMGFAVFQSLAVPKLIDLYRISRDQFSKSLGNESAVALDLGGEMPRIPLMPEPILKYGKMPRLALLRDVRDRKLLTQSWESYFKIARDVAVMIPQTAQIPGGLPEPKFTTQDGITVSYYPLPLATGDLLPNIATTDHTLVMSSSQSYAIDLTKAMAKPQGAAKSVIIDLRLQTKAACDFLDQWVTIAIANPELIFPGKPEAAAEFKLRQPGISLLIRSARSISEVECQVFEENGLHRTTTRIGWKE